MNELRTDDEQVEAIKKWWQENGKAVLGGAALGLALVLGWQGWASYTKGQAERASAYYTQFLNSARADAESAPQQGERLLEEYPDSVYATFAALELGRLAYAKAETATARAHLQWAIDHAADETLAQLARLRLARLLLEEGDLDALRPLLAAPVDPAIAGEFAALRGDLALQEGDREAARRLYGEALEKGVADQNLLRMKLAETGGTADAS